MLAAVTVLACSSAIPHPTNQDEARAIQHWPDASFDQLETGRTAYVRKCGGCHNLYLPGTVPSSDWPEVVESHSTDKGLKLNENTEQSIVRYLVIVSEK